MKNTNTPYHFFGSIDSNDYDVVFFIEEMPNTILEKLSLSKELSQEIALKYSEKLINANLAVVKAGEIVSVYKGTPDELNNAILSTYHLHAQEYELLIKQKLPRNLHLKMIRGLRMILSFISKTQYRTIVKQALQQDIYAKMDVLKTIDFNEIEDFGKGSNPLDLKKSLAFQLGQTLALYDNKEAYTKDEVATFYPELAIYLRRDSNTTMRSIQKYIHLFIHAVESEIPKMEHTTE
ncbi:conserved hypothetical protein [Flavobacterium sp. 9AF]|uniref:hypothetical protein n=1 Tax=Flavobacterium sp. 9AF TaxID=2653142 RepID=UPI0012EF7D5D|nr:hypothetical protein [Flavobacterium sp. 9AF]VXB85240.1 conserved hypothetical protein [Flavobacterium sp. 9AF]